MAGVQRRRGLPPGPLGAAEAEVVARGDASLGVRAGIASSAPPWRWHVGVAGTVLGVGLFAAAFPLLWMMASLLTCTELLRALLGVDGCEQAEGSDEDVVLVMPGVCGFIFHQLGMLHYVCEHFDTTRAKLAGVSSGAVGAAMVLHLEAVAAGAAGSGLEAARLVRRRAQEIFGLLDRQLAPLLWWPLGFLGRLGLAMDDIVEGVKPQRDSLPPSGRLRIGARRVVLRPLPGAVPDCVSRFDEVGDLIATLRASSSVWLIVRVSPLVWLRSKGAAFVDGVNPYSFSCFFDYAWQWWRGMTPRTAPAAAHSGRFDFIYAAWNCGAMRALLPRRGTHVWVTPTAGGRLEITQALRFSGWYMAEQWRSGYAHARDLDAAGHFRALPRRTAGPPGGSSDA